MTLSKVLVATCLAILLPIAPARAEFAPSPAELAALPAYCAARLDEKSDAFKSWKASMGQDFIHIHHYCFALNFMNRARGMASKDRLGTLGAAMTNFDYVLKNTHPDFSLRPEVLMNRGITLSMLHKDEEAIGDLLKSIDMDPRQARAYVTLADLYEKQKNRSKALETVTAGLRQNPDIKSLQRRYTELGGKQPYPAPATIDAPAAKTDGVVSTSKKPVPEPVQDISKTVAPPVESAPPQIGSPTNPYCRFCPN